MRNALTIAAIIGVIAALAFLPRTLVGTRLARWMSQIVMFVRPYGNSGALITRIDTDSPAEKAGLEIGDLIFRFNGNRVKNSAQLRKFVADAAPGMTASVEVIRNGDRKTFIVTIAKSRAGSAPLDQ